MEKKIDKSIIEAISQVCDNSGEYEISYDVTKRLISIYSWGRVKGFSDHIDIAIHLVKRS
jgi:hypothetical protein